MIVMQAIPGFGKLCDGQRSTLLDLVNGSVLVADIPWVAQLLTLDDICQWFSIMQNRSRSNVSVDLSSLVRKKLVHKESAEDGTAHLNLARLNGYAKFIRNLTSKNPDFDTYRRIFNDSLSTLDDSLSLPQRITTLTLCSCPNLVKAGLKYLPKLRCLVIVRCIQLEVVTGWEDIELGFLLIQECPSYQNHPTIQRLPSLINYFLSQVELNNQRLPWILEPGVEQFVRLNRLEVDRNQHLKESGDLSSLKSLKVLRFRNCNALSTIQGLSELHSLIILDLSFCCALSQLPNVGHMKALIMLDIFATSVEEIIGVEEPVNLEKLDCTASKLKRLPDLYHLPQLQRITLRETALVQDPSSKYFEKNMVEFYREEERRMKHVDVSDISDSEHKHSKGCEALYCSDSSDN